MTELDRYEQYQEDERNGFIACDESCKAKEDPETFEDYKKAYEHYKNHSYLSGCSHGA